MSSENLGKIALEASCSVFMMHKHVEQKLLTLTETLTMIDVVCGGWMEENCMPPEG